MIMNFARTAARPRVPVVMYHSVGVKSPDWIWNSLTCPVDLFRRQIELLQAKGYRAATLSEVHERQKSSTIDIDREVVLTFDDGYLDNWVFVYPLLKRMGWRGLIYVNPEFIDPGTELRPNLEDVWEGRCGMDDLPTRGFLNWAEMRRMVADGVMEIGSHSMTHTWFPTGPEIVDYHRPGAASPWMAWNARPDRKHRYLHEDQTGYVPLGMPIHTHGRALGIRRYLPASAEVEAAVGYVAENGGVEFFRRDDWRALQDAVVRDKGNGNGEFESDQAMTDRYRWELCESRRILSEGLGRDVRHFCWPGGAYNDVSWTIAEDAGYETIVTNGRDLRRWHADDPRFIRRISCHDSLSLRGRHMIVDDPYALFHACEVARGRAVHTWILRALKVRESLKPAR